MCIAEALRDVLFITGPVGLESIVYLVRHVALARLSPYTPITPEQRMVVLHLSRNHVLDDNSVDDPVVGVDFYPQVRQAEAALGHGSVTGHGLPRGSIGRQCSAARGRADWAGAPEGPVQEVLDQCILDVLGKRAQMVEVGGWVEHQGHICRCSHFFFSDGTEGGRRSFCAEKKTTTLPS